MTKLYILNEKDFIRETLASKSKPEDISNGYIISLIARYYYDDGRSEEELIDIVKEKMLSFNLLGYQEYRYANKINAICKKLYEEDEEVRFREYEYIPIYENELKIIESLDGDRERKFMFTLFAIARYMDSGGWINKKDSKGISEVFKLANISLSLDKRNEMLYVLHSKGYIHFGKKINNLNIRVDQDDSGEVVYKIKDFSNLGNQYIGTFKHGYRICATPGCGKSVKITGANRKYCRQCSKQRELEKYKKYNEKR